MIQIWNSAEFSLVFTTCTELYYDVNLAISTSMIICTLECEINVPAGINMPAGKIYENNKHASWKI